MKVIIINGYPESGKDTFVKLVQKAVGENISVSEIWSSTPAKTALQELGWNGEDKTPEVRKALAYLMDLSEAMFNGSARYIQREVKLRSIWGRKNNIIFIHCREPKNIRTYKTLLAAKTLLIRRDIPRIFSNERDSGVENYAYDYYIDNNGSLENLETEAKKFVEVLDVK